MILFMNKQAFQTIETQKYQSLIITVLVKIPKGNENGKYGNFTLVIWLNYSFNHNNMHKRLFNSARKANDENI